MLSTYSSILKNHNLRYFDFLNIVYEVRLKFKLSFEIRATIFTVYLVYIYE